MKYSKILLTALSIAFLQSCSDDDTLVSTDDAKLNSSYDVTRLKAVTIEPTISGYENATFTWKLGNEVVGNEQTLGFVSDKAGSYDLTLEIKSASKSANLKPTAWWLKMACPKLSRCLA